MAGNLDFDREVKALSARARDEGVNVIRMVSLLSEFPHRASEVVEMLDFPLDGCGGWVDLKNLWCALIEGHKSIGRHGLDRQTWAKNCRTWLGRQTQLKNEMPRGLARLAIGYGSAQHTLMSLEFVFELAMKEGGARQVNELGAMLAEPAMAHALDGRDEKGEELLRQLCGKVDMEAWVGSQKRQGWIHLWANMAMDGQGPDHVDRALEIIVSQGVRMEQLNEEGQDIMGWILTREIQPHTNDIEILAQVTGALLSQGWSLDDPGMEKAIHRVRPLLENHPAVRRRKLQELSGVSSERSEGETGSTVM